MSEHSAEETTIACPHCGGRILEKALKCRFCNRWLVERPPVPTFDDVGYSRAQPAKHLVLLSVLTLGLYELYWFYRNWRDLRDHAGVELRPGWRTLGLFIPFVNVAMVYQQMRLISAVAAARGLPVGYSPVVVTAVFFGLGLLANATLLWVVSLLTVLPLLPVQETLNRFWSQTQPGKPVREDFAPHELAVLAVGAILTAMAIARTLA